jgi:hypothetical protein
MSTQPPAGKTNVKRIMYIERKDGKPDGQGRIGWVELSRTARSYVYNGKRFNKTKSGYKYNCIEEDTGATYWISGPKKRGGDRLYGGVVEIDEDARVEYWTRIRHSPESVHLKKTF